MAFIIASKIACFQIIKGFYSFSDAVDAWAASKHYVDALSNEAEEYVKDLVVDHKFIIFG